MAAEFLLMLWPPPFTEQWATTYLQVLFEGFLFALGVPTAIYSLIVDNDVKRVAQTRVKARRYFLVTGLLYLSVFIIVWLIHPEPDPSSNNAPVSPPEASATRQDVPPSTASATTPQAQTQPDSTPQPSPQAATPEPASPGNPISMSKAIFAASTVTFLPFAVLVTGLWLNGQLKREKVIDRLAGVLIDTFETKGNLDALALKDLGYLGEHGKAGSEKELVLNVIDQLVLKVQEKEKQENVPYRGYELETLIRHISTMLDNPIQPGDDQNYRRAVEVLANIWRWVSIRRHVSDDALSTRETLKHLALQAVNRTGDETALAFLEIAIDCDSHLVFDIGLAAFNSGKYLIAAAALTKLEVMAAKALATSKDLDVQEETTANLVGMVAHFATAGPASFMRAEISLQYNEELFAPTVRGAIEQAFIYQYTDGRYDTANKIKSLLTEAGKMKCVDLDRPVPVLSRINESKSSATGHGVEET